MIYFWQQKEFPNFQFQPSNFTNQIENFTLLLGEINGLFQNISIEEQQEIFIQFAIFEAIKTSEIEGEYFSREDIMSSIQNQLGISTNFISKDKKAQAVSALMLQVRADYSRPFSIEMLKKWHSILMQYNLGINEGNWRKSIEPMQIISGRYGNISVHFEAPPATAVPILMQQFEDWYNYFAIDSLGLVGNAMFRSALAHLYFETIHPFEDGNGRIGRALSEKTLVDKLEKPLILSLSKSIEKNKKEYYSELKNAQRQQDVNQWISFFFNILIEAQNEVLATVYFSVKKAQFFDKFKEKLNQRQLKVISKMMEYGIDGFKGGMTAKKYISLTKTSKATATRDLQDLFEMGVFTKHGFGRAVSYQLRGLQIDENSITKL